MDRISNLPDVLIEKILFKIPTLEAVRTCVLSKSWLSKWTMVPKLQLDVSFITQARSIKEERPFDYVYIVNSLLSQHVGPLDEVYLVIPILPHPQIDYISQAIRVVARPGIQKLTIFKWSSDPYIWPSSLSISPSLTCLELRNCEIKREPFSRGFQNLTSLVFNDVKCDPDILSTCISNSPNLEKIELQNLGFDGLDVSISAPKLENLVVKGMFRFIYLNARKLKQLEIYLRLCEYEWSSEEYIPEFFDSLRQLESLSMGAEIYWLFREAGNPDPPRALPIELGQLRVFKLTRVVFCNAEMLLVFLSIIYSCPCLNILEIRGTSPYTYGKEMSFRVKTYGANTLQHLKKVYIGPVVGFENDMSVIEILLHCSPALQEMAIWHQQQYNRESFESALGKLYRASPSVSIIIHSENRYEHVFST